MKHILLWLKTKWILLVIIALGLFLRLYGYNWGTPLLLHPDEPAITEQAYLLVKNKTYAPTFFGRPNHLSIYGSALLYTVASPLAFHGQPLEKTFETNRPFYYYLSRIVMAIVGTVSIVVASLIGLEFSVVASILAALLFAIFPPYVIHAHYVTPDVTSTCLTLLTILFSIKYLKQKQLKHLIILGIVAGCSVAEKYPGIANLGMAGLVVLLANYRNIKQLFIHGGVLCLTFVTSLFLAAPFLFLKFNSVIAALKIESRSVQLGVPTLGFLGNLYYYANDFYTNGGLILSILMLFGVILAIKQYRIRALPLFLGFIYWISLSKIALHWSRWGLPMYVTPLLLATLALDFCLSKFRHNQGKYIVLFLIFISVSAQLLLDRTNLIKLNARDTRVVALDYLKTHDITKDNTLYEGYTPLASGDKGNTKYDVSQLKDRKFKYAILSSTMYGRYLKENKDGMYKKNNDFYEIVTKKKLVTQIKSQCNTISFKSIIPEITNIFSTVDSKCTTGPELKVYQL